MSDFDQAELHRQRQGVWGVNEYWIGEKCEFHQQKYIWDSLQMTQEELSAEGRSSWVYVVRFRGDVLELTRRDGRGQEGKHEWTLAVYSVRFDKDRLGSIDAIPINWNDNLPPGEDFDSGVPLLGIYSVDGKQMQIYFSKQQQRPTEIPKVLEPGEVLLKIERRGPGEIVPIEADGSCDLNKDFVVSESGYVPMAGKTFLESIGSISPPKPFQYPASKAPNLFVYRRSNGWIAQTEIR